jgi:hypothetical protein
MKNEKNEKKKKMKRKGMVIVMFEEDGVSFNKNLPPWLGYFFRMDSANLRPFLYCRSS